MNQRPTMVLPDGIAEEQMVKVAKEKFLLQQQLGVSLSIYQQLVSDDVQFARDEREHRKLNFIEGGGTLEQFYASEELNALHINPPEICALTHEYTEAFLKASAPLLEKLMS